MTNISNEPIVCEHDGTLSAVEDALHSLWAVVNKLSRIRATSRERYCVTVYGSARIKPGQPLYEDVKQLTKRLAELNCDIVTGGGPGLMQAANEGAQLGDPHDKTQSVGIRVALPFEQSSNPFVEQAYTHQTFYTRLHQFVRMSNAFVVVNGGIGTTLEAMLAWQLIQVRHVTGVPLIMVGQMWRDLVNWANKHMIGHEPKLANVEDMELPICVDTVDEAITLLTPRIETFAERNKG